MARGGHSLGAALLAVSIGLGLGGPAALGGDSLEEELKCEEAVVHLDDCCSGFHPEDVYCKHRFDGCDAPDDQTLDIDNSDCIRELSCSELRDRGVCTRVVEGQSEVCP